MINIIEENCIMNARFDIAYEKWGSFSASLTGSYDIAGKLRYSPADGLQLELVGNSANNKSIDNQQNWLPVLFGRLIDGTNVTLLDCHVRRRMFGMQGSCCPIEIVFQRIIIGDCISDITNTSFSQCSIELTSLSSWLGAPEVSADVRASKIQYKLPDEIEVRLPEHDVKLVFSTNISHASSIQNYGLKWTSDILIIPNQPKLLTWYEEIIQRVQHLLSLLMGDLVFIRKFDMYSAASEENEANRFKHHLSLLYHQSGKVNFEEIHPGSVMIPYRNITVEFPTILQKWFAMPKQAALATTVFFAGQALESPVLNLEYLRITQVAESYHRALRVGCYMNQDEYDLICQKIIEQIPSSISKSHRQSLESKLKYGNEYSLRKRILELFKRLPIDLQTRILGGENSIDLSEFCNKAKNTRNYFTHYSVELENDIFDNDKAFIASRKFRVLLIANLLLDLGLPENRLLEFLQSHPETQHWMDLPL